MNPAKDVISIMTALMLTSTGLTGPSSVPVVNEALKSVPFEETITKAEEYDITLEALALFETSKSISGTELIEAHVSDLASEKHKTASQFFDSADEESLWYCSEIPMKKEHQKLLWECCKERGLDYIDMLALVSLESNFEEKCSSRKYKGYFQISADYGPKLSKALNTENKPLDGTVNIKWGTAFYSWILMDDRVKLKQGKAQRDAALSIYQRGAGGYDRRGLNKKYLSKYYKKRDTIVSYFNAD